LLRSGRKSCLQFCMEQIKMNMITTGAFLNEMDASDKQDTLVNKLVSAWEQKNSKTARAGGVSLMALSLAACGSSDDDTVSFTQAQLDAAKAAATSAAEATAATAATAAAAAAATAATAAAAAAATAQAAAVAAVDITSDNAAAVLTAVTAVDSSATTVAEVKSNATAAATVTTATTAVFTTGIDALSGGTAADTFIGDNNTISAADNVGGGDGSDTLKLYGGTTVPDVTSIENLEMHHTAMVAMNLAVGNLSGVSSLEINGAEASDKTITIGAGDSITLEAMTAGGANDEVIIAGAAASVTAATVNLVDMSDTTGVIVDIAGTGITTVTLNETGSTSISYIDFQADTANVAVSTVNINATGKGVNIIDVEDATTINASGSTAAVNVDSAINKSTITMGTGKDDVSLDHASTVAIETTVNMGAGNDSLTITASNGIADLVDNKVTLDGGDGVDSITMIDALAAGLGGLSAANYTKKGISNFETVNISDVSTTNVDFSTMTGVTKVDLKGAVDGSVTHTIAASSTLEMSVAGTNTPATTVTVKGAADAGSNSDSMTLNLNGAHAAATTNTDFGDTTIANTETINISSTNSTSTITLTTGDNEMGLIAVHAATINVTGDAALDLSSDPLEDAVTVFNAADFTGKSLSVSFAGANAGVTFTSAGTTASTVVGGSFADLITSAGGGDRITPGNGIDIITTGAGSDTVNLDNLVLSTNRSTIKDFSATSDEIEIGGAETSVATTTGTAPVMGTVTAKATAHTLGDVDVTEFAFDVGSSGDLSASLTGSELLKGISTTSSAATLAVDAASDSTFVVAYDAGNAYLYYIAEAGGSAAVGASEIALIATLEGVAVGTLAQANFDLV
jgi:hypothetical protein